MFNIYSKGGVQINKINGEFISGLIDTAGRNIRPGSKIADMFGKCFVNTLETTTELLEDGTAYVFTGDIPAMWLRDSSAQLHHYLRFCKTDMTLQRIIEGLIRRQLMYLSIDPYANAFNKEPNDQGHKGDLTEHNPWVWERKFEIDSQCYPVQLAYLYWKETGITSLFDETFKKTLISILKLWKTEQKHHENSLYSFRRLNCPESDTLKCDGRGTPVNYTGMIWSGFRPSDDACRFGFLIPSNMFAAVVLKYIEEMAQTIFKDDELQQVAAGLRKDIEYGINNYAVYLHPAYGKIYAYETDGYGNYNLMDDANVPSLLSIPYIGYAPKDDLVYLNTRKFILSQDNPFYFTGKHACGIGSPHTPRGYIWHIGLIMQALTSGDEKEIRRIFKILEETDAMTGYMHEGFNADNPNEYTRPWFAWANSLFAELVLEHYDLIG